MNTFHKKQIISSSLFLIFLSISANALAVGGGVTFNVDEDPIPARPHTFQADSLDFTYHACTDLFTEPGEPEKVYLEESGYFYISSYQDDDGVVDSQINHFLPNGYHLYGKYNFVASQVGNYATHIGDRRDYAIESASIKLYLDPNSDTILGLGPVPDCQLTREYTEDDKLIGDANEIFAGEKSEKNRLANGDFEIEFTNWQWSTLPAPPILPFPATRLVFNANVTRLLGSVDGDHRPEGSGNMFWKFWILEPGGPIDPLDTFDPLDF